MRAILKHLYALSWVAILKLYLSVFRFISVFIRIYKLYIYRISLKIRF